MSSLQDYSLIKILPDSLKGDPFLLALADAVEKELKEAYRDAEKLSDFRDITNMPENLLDYLAYQRHVDFYDNHLTLIQKQELVGNATVWHRKKGTKWAVEKVTSIVFPNAEVREWFEYGGEPFHFQIEIEETNITKTELKRLTEMVESTKNLRSVMESVVIKILGEKIRLEVKSKNYSVPYPITNMFTTAQENGKLLSNTIPVKSTVRVFVAPYPITNNFTAEMILEKRVNEKVNMKSTSYTSTVNYSNTGTIYTGEVEL